MLKIFNARFFVITLIVIALYIDDESPVVSVAVIRALLPMRNVALKEFGRQGKNASTGVYVHIFRLILASRSLFFLVSSISLDFVAENQLYTHGIYTYSDISRCFVFISVFPSSERFRYERKTRK